MFDYDAASGTFAPATSATKPPQRNDAKCGAACHTLAEQFGGTRSCVWRHPNQSAQEGLRNSKGLT